MSFQSIFNGIFSISPSSDVISDRVDTIIKSYLDNLDYKSDVVTLEGPFLPEQKAVKNIPRYKSCLHDTLYHINCYINRHFLILCDNDELPTRDNSRIELGISPFNHNIGLFVDDNGSGELEVLEIDRLILLNEKDREKMKELVEKFPLSKKELSGVSVPIDGS